MAAFPQSFISMYIYMLSGPYEVDIYQLGLLLNLEILSAESSCPGSPDWPSCQSVPGFRLSLSGLLSGLLGEFHTDLLELRPLL